ncbi:MAG: N-6 DNA methylase [Terriglobia bacterium]
MKTKRLKSKRAELQQLVLTPPGIRNKFCELSALDNEASVEQFFASRLLTDMGYRDQQIKPKTSLETLATSRGRTKLNYKPDYALVVRKKIRWVLDAKETGESLDEWTGQCSSYCLLLNQRNTSENHVKYYVLTNGVTTRVYQWDLEEPLLELAFTDFVDSNSKYQQFGDLLREDRFANPSTSATQGPTHTLRRLSIAEMNANFVWCHQFIYRKDDMSQSDAFMAFVKIIFLKLLSDKRVHSQHPELANAKEIVLPHAEVRFSKQWIEERETDHPNPLDALQFQSLIGKLEKEIQEGNRKRIFDATDHINLLPETIKGVVERLECSDLYAIDADLNGRLFETFLNATMRGKDLGQYFTPRSVVELAVKLAGIKVTKTKQDIVIDACCGSAGFLINILADMWEKVDNNSTLSQAEKMSLRKHIADDCIFGVDSARGPILARIARMNMYLHGDGGSRIYQADALDPDVVEVPTDSAELNRERSELRALLSIPGGFADVVVTNPPFAKEYQRKHPREAAILDRYTLAFDNRGGQRKAKKSLKSSLMFLERYCQILKPGTGRIVTVMDDSILGGSKYKRVRDFIRENYIVLAVVSLPGDAFQRSKARVKTSLVCLRKRKDATEEQPPVFMHYCTMVGIDDPARQRTLPVDSANRAAAKKEIADVGNAYEAFLNGESSAAKWTVPAEAVSNRMDVKSCLPKPGRHVAFWKKAGYSVSPLSELLDIVYPKGRAEAQDIDDEIDEVLETEEQSEVTLDEETDENLIVTRDCDDLVKHLRVRYDGFCEEGEEIYASDSKYVRLYRVKTNDIVMSHIGATYGAIAIVPQWLDGCVVTSEYTVFRAKPGMDQRLVWMLVRSPECRADLLMMATGISRNRVHGSEALGIRVPHPSKSLSLNNY